MFAGGLIYHTGIPKVMLGRTNKAMTWEKNIPGSTNATGHLTLPMISLDPFHTLRHILIKVMVTHRGAPVHPMLMPLLLATCFHGPNPSTKLLHLLMHILELQPLKHYCHNLPCILNPNSHRPLRSRCLCSRVQPIPKIQRKRIRGRVTRVTRVTKVTNIVNPRGTSLTPTTRNMEANPSITRLFVRTSLVHFVVCMATIHMSVPSYPRCAKSGKLKKLLEVSNHLRILCHLNRHCSQILSLTKDLWFLNLS